MNAPRISRERSSLSLVDGIVVVGSLTCYALLHAQMNVQWSQIRELLFYEFELGYNVAWAKTKKICMKGKGVLNHRWLKKFRLCCKNLDHQERSSRPKLKAVLKAVEKTNYKKVSQVGNHSRRWPEGFLFNSYFTEI